MTRRLATGARLVIATHNDGKLRELADLLAPHGVLATGAAALGLAEPEETEDSFAGNARLKAVAAARATGLPALSDDSGLCVTALDGRPGIHTARWGGPARDFALGMRRVHQEMGGATDRSAHFVCVLCLAWPDGSADCFEGVSPGALIWPPRGMQGFGYDPMFVPDGDSRSYGEMPAEEKHATNHRARALHAFALDCLPEPRQGG